MKKLFVLLTIIVIVPCLGVICHAEDEADKYLAEFENIIPSHMQSGITDGEILQNSLGFEEILSEILNAASREKTKIFAFFFSLLGALVLLALSSSFTGRFSGAVSAAVGCCVSVLIFSSVYGIYSSVSVAVSEANDFFVALIPIAVGITSLGGGVFAAGVQSAGMSITAAAVSKLWGVAFTSVSGLGLSMSLISSYGGKGTATVAGWVKKSFGWILGIATALISGTLALQTMVASARDSAAMRAARYAASGLIPVIGSTVSGALATLASGISYVKGIIGGGAVLVLISLLLSPLILLLIYRCALSFISFLADFFEISSAKGIFGAYLYSLDTVVITYTLSCVVYVFEIILFVKSGVALL